MISVCMASYNGERFIKKQIGSILSQLSPADELIISDDGSTDETVNIINTLKKNDNRIILLTHTKNENLKNIKNSKSFYFATSNFENALKKAKGDYIFLSDQDDIWQVNKVKRCLYELQNYDLVMSNYSIIDENNEIIISKKLIKCPVSYKSLILNIIRSKFLGCTMAFTRKALIKALPFPKRLIAHDLWIGCCNYKNMTFIDEPLHLYRRHGNNVSTSSEKSSNSLFYRIKYRVIFLFVFLLKKIVRNK